jgi:hypothetical protein
MEDNGEKAISAAEKRARIAELLREGLSQAEVG